VTGRHRRGSDCARIAPVSADRTKQRGEGHTEGCPEQLIARRNSPWHGTGRGRDDGCRTGSCRRGAVAELSARVGRTREGEGVWQMAQMREGRWASRARGSKGARAQGRGRRTRGRGCVHDGEIVGERLGTTDRWGRWDIERERGHGEKNGADSSTPQSSEREGGRARSVWHRQAGPAGQAPKARGCRHGDWASGLVWAEIGFPFSRDFLIAFLFIFYRVFNSNSNQVLNSNQIKYMQQFKEYLGSI
jgi:hypothetical protein